MLKRFFRSIIYIAVVVGIMFLLCKRFFGVSTLNNLLEEIIQNMPFGDFTYILVTKKYQTLSELISLNYLASNFLKLLLTVFIYRIIGRFIIKIVGLLATIPSENFNAMNNVTFNFYENANKLLFGFIETIGMAFCAVGAGYLQGLVSQYLVLHIGSIFASVFETVISVLLLLICVKIAVTVTKKLSGLYVGASIIGDFIKMIISNLIFCTLAIINENPAIASACGITCIMLFGISLILGSISPMKSK